MSVRYEFSMCPECGFVTFQERTAQRADLCSEPDLIHAVDLNIRLRAAGMPEIVRHDSYGGMTTPHSAERKRLYTELLTKEGYHENSNV